MFGWQILRLYNCEKFDQICDGGDIKVTYTAAWAVIQSMTDAAAKTAISIGNRCKF